METKNLTQFAQPIIGGFFGAYYSIALIGPLIMLFNNSNSDTMGLSVANIVALPLITSFVYWIITISVEWMNNYSNSLTAPLPQTSHENKDVPLIACIICVTAIVMASRGLISPSEIPMWIAGVCTVIFLQLRSIPLLLGES